MAALALRVIDLDHGSAGLSLGPPGHRTPDLPLKAGSACTSGDDRDG
jgi:hypothetical protein